ncbi:MAG: rRNA (guanine966-N2)-methyltransferase [Clostridia bacterium]|jgi:16S rRNA (guanine(966)-N(2))-methyltransferase RsmD|nr:rRNA (guanine966-N2)-methyltransferase [Clostridia bacterium]MDN5322776.1 rRNA (guanine966-N2)-methyltransferase [Clostridia bacterium]
MRVIAGMCRGKRLKSVKGLSTRPTADRVKEAVFNVLGSRIIEAKVLDLFGGTGNIGIEALSRGAKFVYFVEKDRKAVQIIKENVTWCNFNEKVEIYPVDCFKALKILKEKNIKFNLVYLDPPYKLLIIDDLLEEIAKTDLLDVNGIIIAETAKNTELLSNFDHLNKVREDHYGDTKITYYQRN